MRKREPNSDRIVVSDHTLIREVGRGAYGSVWLAKSVTGAFRAVKVVYRAQFGDDVPFHREYRGIVRFEPVSRLHIGLVQILHVGMASSREYFYYVMELADSKEKSDGFDPTSYSPKTLHSELKRLGRFPVEEALATALATAEAIDYLHKNRLLHRDIKPSNIIFVSGQPKLADVGLVAGEDDTFSFVGTTGYIAPEGPTSGRADIFSFGKVLYEIITGNPLLDFPQLPVSFPRWQDREGVAEINEVVLKACAWDPAQRYESMDEVIVDLRRIVRGESMVQGRRWEARIAILRRLAVVFVLAVLLIAIGFALSRPSKEERLDLVMGQFYLTNSTNLDGMRLGRRFRAIENLNQFIEDYPSAARRNAIVDLRFRARSVPDIDDDHGIVLPVGERLGEIVFDRPGGFAASYNPAGRIEVLQLETGTSIASVSCETHRPRVMTLLGEAGVLAWSVREGDGSFAVHIESWHGEFPGVTVPSELEVTAMTWVSSSAKDALLMVASNDGSIRSLDIAGRERGLGRLDSLFHNRLVPNRLSASPNGTYLAAWDTNRFELRLLHVKDLAPLKNVFPHPAAICDLAWRRTGPPSFVTACKDGFVRCYSTANRDGTPVLKGASPENAALICVDFLPGGNGILALGERGQVTLFQCPLSVNQGTRERIAPRVSGASLGTRLKTLFSLGDESVMGWFDSPSQLKVWPAVFDVARQTVTFDYESEEFFAGSSLIDPVSRLLGLEEQNLMRIVHLDGKLTEVSLRLPDLPFKTFLGEGRGLLAAGPRHALVFPFYQLPLSDRSQQGMQLGPAVAVDLPTRSSISAVAVAVKSDLFGLAADSRVYLYKASSLQLEEEYLLGEGLDVLALNHDGKTIAGANSTDGMVWVVGQKQIQLDDMGFAPRRLEFSANGDRLMIAGTDGYALWDLALNSLIGSWERAVLGARPPVTCHLDNELWAVELSAGRLTLLDAQGRILGPDIDVSGGEAILELFFDFQNRLYVVSQSGRVDSVGLNQLAGSMDKALFDSVPAGPSRITGMVGQESIELWPVTGRLENLSTVYDTDVERSNPANFSDEHAGLRWGTYGNVLLRVGRYDEGLRAFLRARQLFEEGGQPTGDQWMLPYIDRGIADAQAELGRLPSGPIKELYVKLVSDYPYHNFYYRFARHLWVSGDPHDALDGLQMGVKVARLDAISTSIEYPHLLCANWFLQSACYSRLGQFVEAEKAYVRGLDLLRSDPPRVDIKYSYNETLEAMEWAVEAAERLKQ